jgi:hypothetical protein
MLLESLQKLTLLLSALGFIITTVLGNVVVMFLYNMIFCHGTTLGIVARCTLQLCLWRVLPCHFLNLQNPAQHAPIPQNPILFCFCHYKLCLSLLLSHKNKTKQSKKQETQNSNQALVPYKQVSHSTFIKLPFYCLGDPHHDQQTEAYPGAEVCCQWLLGPLSPNFAQHSFSGFST